jgi:phosphinothricin acetyltransferase
MPLRRPPDRERDGSVVTAMDGVAMDEAAVTVRDAVDADMAAVQAIYAHHVLTGLGSFEETPPDLAEMMARRRGVLDRGLPYLVAEADGAVRGFAYAGPFRPRPAYRYVLENSVYVAADAVGRGIGRSLLRILIERCTAAGYRQMIAVIGDAGNRGSIGLHTAAGFRRVGHLPSAGFKFGRWVDLVIMQRALGPGDGTLPGG